MPIPLGIIGCGRHARHHVDNLDGHLFAHSAWDPDKTVLENFPSALKWNTLEEMLAEEEVQAVMICSPEQFHLKQIELALNAGKHVFCEKPLMVPGEDIAMLEAAFDLAAKKKLVLTSCHPRRYDRPIEWLRHELAHSGIFLDFGKVISFDFDFSYHAPSNEWKHARSLLLDHLNHEIDLMNCLFGIKGLNAWKLHDSFDRYEVAGKRDDGITFHFRGTRRLKNHVYPEWCRVRFERGEVELDMMHGQAYYKNHDQKQTYIKSDLAIDYDGRLKKVNADFGDCQITWEQAGYLSRAEMLMNTEAGIILQNEGVRRINVRC